MMHQDEKKWYLFKELEKLLQRIDLSGHINTIEELRTKLELPKVDDRHAYVVNGKQAYMLLVN